VSAQKRVVIVACSGIGKALGSVAREAAYELCDELRPDSTELVALSKLVLGEPGAQARVQQSRAITLDGCKLYCAAKLVQHSGGSLAHQVGVFDIYRKHKHLRPEGIAELNDAGQKLARVVAGEVAKLVDGVGRDGTANGGSHG
jgi:uncharacterized metal-binding protein